MVKVLVLGGGFPGICYVVIRQGTNEQPNIGQQWIRWVSNDNTVCSKN